MVLRISSPRASLLAHALSTPDSSSMPWTSASGVGLPYLDHTQGCIEEPLPYPATKLVITQYLKTSADPLFWAIIIVGAFYDADDRILWSSRLFAGHLGIERTEHEQWNGSDLGEESEAGSGTPILATLRKDL